MDAIRLHETGGPQSLRMETVPQPEPGAGELVVRLRAAALNRRDVFITHGKYPNIALPATLGSDGAGIVEESGDEVVIDPMLDWGGNPHVWGDRASILGMPRAGTFAQYVAVPRQNVHAKPAHLSFEQAAALPLAGLTAYRAVVTRAQVRRGETVLVTGIGGGVQTFALLFAKAAGARVAVTSSSDAKLQRARELGADLTANYRTDPNWHKTLRKEAGNIDVAVDSAGGETFARALGMVRPGGRVVTYGGTHAESTIRMFPIFWNHLTILGTSMGSPQDFAAMLALVERDKLVPALDRTFPMSEAAAAAAHLDAGEQFGKVLLAIP